MSDMSQRAEGSQHVTKAAAAIARRDLTDRKRRNEKAEHVPLQYPPALLLGAVFSAAVVLYYLVWILQEAAALRKALLAVIHGSESLPGGTQELRAALSQGPGHLARLATSGLGLGGIEVVFEPLARAAVTGDARSGAHGNFTSNFTRTAEEAERDAVTIVNIFYFTSVFSAVIAVLGVLKVNVSSFQGFRSHYSRLVRGEVPKAAHLGPTEASLFPGILFSINLLAPVFLMIVSFIVSTALTLLILARGHMRSIGDWVLSILLPVLLLLVFKQLVDRVLFKKILMTDNGFIKRPMPFVVVFGAATMVNFVHGILFAVIRLVTVLIFAGCSVMFSVDRTINETNDAVYDSFRALVQATNEAQNPIFLCAVRSLYPRIDHTFQLPYELSCTDASRARRLRVRNKFWLAVVLYKNPPCEYNNFFAMSEYRWFNIKYPNEDDTMANKLAAHFGMLAEHVGDATTQAKAKAAGMFQPIGISDVDPVILSGDHDDIFSEPPPRGTGPTQTHQLDILVAHETRPRSDTEAEM